MFTRQEVCALTGIPVERFKSMIRRDQIVTINVPAGASERNRDAARERGWNYFSAMDVFMIAVQERLSCEIGYADGLSAETALKIVSYNAEGLRDLFWRSLARKPEADRWIGYVGFSGDVDLNNGGANIFGTLSEVAKSIERMGHNGEQPLRVFLVNADSVLSEVAARALKHLDIDFVVSGKVEDSARKQRPS